MQDVKKLVKISTRIDPKKTNFLDKSELPYELCQSCIIKKKNTILYLIL